MFSVTNQLYPLLGDRGELFEAGLARDERVSGQRRRLVVTEQLRGGGSGGRPRATKERATAARFPFNALPVGLHISHCVFPWQGEITGCRVTEKDEVEDISHENRIVYALNV